MSETCNQIYCNDAIDMLLNRNKDVPDIMRVRLARKDFLVARKGVACPDVLCIPLCSLEIWQTRLKDGKH